MSPIRSQEIKGKIGSVPLLSANGGQTATYPPFLVPVENAASNAMYTFPLQTTPAVMTNQPPVHQMHPPQFPFRLPNVANKEQPSINQDCVQHMMASPGIYAMDRGLVNRLEDIRGTCHTGEFAGYHATPNITHVDT